MLLALLVVVAMAPATALADDVAAERARLANQRIQAEEERRAREEEQRLEQAKAQAQASSEDPGETTVGVAESAEQPRDAGSEPVTRSTQGGVSGAPVDKIEMSRALEQLRELGALREAGYLTEEEFEQLKKKILDGAL